MKYNQPDEKNRRRRAEHSADPLLGEPSMSAPSPMPGRPAASYVKPKSAEPVPQADWNPPQDQTTASWANNQYPVKQGYSTVRQNYPPPSQGIPGGQLPAQQYGGWQQGYSPAPQQQSYPHYQQPSGRGWSQPYPVQNQPQNNWQGGYNVNQWNGGNGYVPGYENMSGHGRGGNGSGGGHSGAGKASGSAKGGKTPLGTGGIIKLIAAMAVLVAAVVLTVNFISQKNETNAINEMVTAYNDRYCEGVYVDGIHLGGMTREEARQAVQKSAQLKCDEWNVSLETAAGEYLGEINSYHLGMTVHVDDALEEAWRQGHTGATINDRKAAMDALLETPFHTSTALPGSDTAAIDRILNEIAGSIYMPASDAYAQFDPTVNLASPFTIVPEVVGKYLDVTSIKEQVYDMVSRMESGVITIEPTPLYPTFTAADVAQKTSLIGSAYTAISSTSEEGRNQNIVRACELINGTIIEPGKNFSFNGVVGKRSKANGFQLATVYNYGKEEPGYGGGVCQVSSTLYWAAIKANLEIVKREQHALKVNYTDFGFDATVNYDGRKIDFAFRNNTDSPIYIITKVMLKPKVDRNHYLVICDIYGPAMEPGVTYNIEAVTTEVPIPEATIVPDTKAEHVVYVDDPPYTAKGAVGYEVDSYKVKYVDGKEVERTFLYHDSYPAVQPVTYVGVSERPIETDEPW